MQIISNLLLNNTTILFLILGHKYSYEENTINQENQKNIDELLIRHRKLFG